MFRTLATAALIAATLPAAAMAASHWTTGGVNFRTGPGTYYDVIGYLPKCAALDSYGWQDGWVEISWEGQRGWVSGKYLAESNAHCGYGKKKAYEGGDTYSSGY
ncbi:SH3 domain-containing protein [Rhodobacter sp. Har01]|uniref:SH3 domain-containing protein n=1 Tax=Rhodobacter sp. Har01 TaxID=2883999 RepID=UPI001D060BEF|nr:SH3 domain-containing protein [Rhodobacter sp. Har01]MCB6177791.1 SH3 domain-containing protein [Rhodobacter sp. Har01]